MKEGLWANIWAKRRRGEKMRKKGEKGAPTPDAIRSAQKEESPATSIGNASVALPPTARFKTVSVTDRRRKKDQHPVLLKRFRKYMEDQKDA